MNQDLMHPLLASSFTNLVRLTCSYGCERRFVPRLLYVMLMALVRARRHGLLGNTAFFRHILVDLIVLTLLIGVSVLAVLLVLPRLTKSVPAILVGVVAATAVTAVFGLSGEGVATVGELPQVAPKPLPITTAVVRLAGICRNGSGPAGTVHCATT